MLFFASILAAAVATNAAPAASEAPARQLTREEIIARFRAPPTTRVSGLVQVIADCPADMRREYQGPIARFAADICNDLYRHRRVQPVLFKEPGLIIHIGDVRTNEAAVAVKLALDVAEVPGRSLEARRRDGRDAHLHSCAGLCGSPQTGT